MFIYKVESGYSSPESASGYFSSPEGAAAAVTKQIGTSDKHKAIFNADGVTSLIKGMRVTRHGISILNARIYKRTLK